MFSPCTPPSRRSGPRARSRRPSHPSASQHAARTSTASRRAARAPAPSRAPRRPAAARSPPRAACRCHASRAACGRTGPSPSSSPIRCPRRSHPPDTTTMLNLRTSMRCWTWWTMSFSDIGLRDDDQVRAAGDAARHREPPRVAAHRPRQPSRAGAPRPSCAAVHRLSDERRRADTKPMQ